jgi:hypothetical protein
MHTEKQCHIQLGDEAVLVHFPSLLAICCPRGLSPHLLCVLKHHVAMTVECLDTCENLAVVSARDQDLGARADGGLEDGEGTGCELVLLDL